MSWSLVGLTSILATDGNGELAARLLGLADQLQELIDAPLMPDVNSTYDYATSHSMAVLGADRFSIIRAAGVVADLE